MKQQNEITNSETEKCRRVVQAFDELFNRTNIFVLDTGKYGFALLKYDDHNEVYSIKTYANSNRLFHALWQEWLIEELIELCINTPLIDLDFDEMFHRLPFSQRQTLLKAKKHFRSESNNKNIPVTAPVASNTNDLEKNKCRIIAQIFREVLESHDIVLKETEKFGFIMLEYYKPRSNFDSVIVFRDSQKMFDILLNEWFDCLITDLMEERQANNIDIDDFYHGLPEEEKEKLENRKIEFVREALEKIDPPPNSIADHT